MASALVFELSKVATLHIREAMVAHLIHVDAAFAQRVADGLGLSKMPEAPPALIVQDMDESPSLGLIGKMKNTLEGRCVGILVNDGSDLNTVTAIETAVLGAGGDIKMIAPKVGGAKMSDGTLLMADGQLAGTPSVMFDAIAVVLSESGARALFEDSSAKDFVRDAFVHLKAIVFDKGGQSLCEKANISADQAVFAASDVAGFIVAATTRQWGREASVRTLA